MHKAAILIISILLAGVFGSIRTSAQDSPRAEDGFRVTLDVNLIALDVVVTDEMGRAVLNLSREDFEIYEDGERQELRSFTSVDTPYNVLLLFDCSGSTEPSWPFLVQAMGRFTGHLRSQDGIAIAQFGSGFKRLLDWSSVKDRQLSATVEVGDKTCGGTDLYGSIGRSLSEVAKTTGRKGIIVLTDGQHQEIPRQPITSRTALKSRYVDPPQDGDFQRLLRSVRGSGTVFYFLAVNTDLNPSTVGAGGEYDPLEIYNMQQARLRLELLALASGGRVGYPSIPSDVVPLFEQIGRDLGTSYGLAYSSTHPGKGRHTIEVRVRDKSLKVRQSQDSYTR